MKVDLIFLSIACVISVFCGIIIGSHKVQTEYIDAIKMWDIIDRSCEEQGKKAFLHEIFANKDEMLYETICQ